MRNASVSYADCPPNDSTDSSFSRWREWEWAATCFCDMYGKGCLHTGSRRRTHSMLHTGHLQVLLIFWGSRLGTAPPTQAPEVSFLSFILSDKACECALVALLQPRGPWFGMAKRMWLGSSGKNPEHRTYCLLKVTSFFSSRVQTLLFLTACERLCVIEWRKSDWGTWFHVLLTVENIPLPMVALAGILSISS
jgi:hypothetical protein